MRWLRLIGIAFGSLIAAALVVTLVELVMAVLLGAAMQILPPLEPIAALLTGLFRTGTLITAIATFVLGHLIYRDIVRRDRKPAPVAGKSNA